MTHSVSPQPHNPFWHALHGKRVLVVGAGKTGASAIRCLHRQQALVVVWDTRDDAVITDDLLPLIETTYFGHSQDLNWQGIDGVVLSPGVSPSLEELQNAFLYHLPVIGDIELFALLLERRPSRPTLIGVTGSNGKTTVTLLIEHILKSAGKSVQAVGNVGEPALDSLLDLPDYIVLELSSFQLEMTSSLSLDVACYLNLSEDHLDRHGSLGAYGQAKQRIYRGCKSAVFWHDQALTYPKNAVENLHSFSVEADSTAKWTLLDTDTIMLDGQHCISVKGATIAGLHNILNIQAAAAATYQLGIAPDIIETAMRSFQAPPHRCVTISRHGGIEWIDDSKATNPGATLAALNGIGPLVQGRLILIAGGDGKGANFDVLSEALNHYVFSVFAIGKDAHAIAALHTNARVVDTLEEAVTLAAAQAQQGDVILLSPACASIDMFKNYIHRAEVFAASVSRLAA